MAKELVHAQMRASEILKFQQTGEGCTQAEKGRWQHEDEAFMDALELIDRRESPSQVRGQDPLLMSDVFSGNETTSIMSRSRETVSNSIHRVY
jgi:hypothetical protein